MSPARLLADLAARGVNLLAVDGRLRVDAPAGALTDADREALARHKPTLITLLAEPRMIAPHEDEDKAEAERLLAEVRDAFARVELDVASGKAPPARASAMQRWAEVAEGLVNNREMEAARGWDALELLRGTVRSAYQTATGRHQRPQDGTNGHRTAVGR